MARAGRTEDLKGDEEWFDGLTVAQRERHQIIQLEKADEGVGDDADFKMVECWKAATAQLRQEIASGRRFRVHDVNREPDAPSPKKTQPKSKIRQK